MICQKRLPKIQGREKEMKPKRQNRVTVSDVHLHGISEGDEREHGAAGIFQKPHQVISQASWQGLTYRFRNTGDLKQDK